MPHIVVKMYPGRTEEQKSAFTEKIVECALKELQCRKEALSVAIEEVSPEEWMDRVYTPEIEGRVETLTKKPGYGPLAE